MNIFVAGASGAIGQPLIAGLIRRGHTVTGLTQSEAGAKKLEALGATAAIANAFDAAALEAALRKSNAEVVIDELTYLPKHPSDLVKYLPGDRKLRLEGGGNLHRAAETSGVRRYIIQSTGFFCKAAPNTLADESSPLAIDATPGVASSAQTYVTLEDRVLNSTMEGVALRYGFFYGPNTWYNPDGGTADVVRQQQLPIIGDGESVWSFIHIDDAAHATAAAVTAEPGIYIITDDNPSPVSLWLPKFAEWVGAPPPPHVTVEQAIQLAGEDAVYYYTKLSGASNKKAKQAFNFNPRPLEWLKS